MCAALWPDKEDKPTDNPITRAEHEEFARRMEDEHNRQNHRINDLEKQVTEISKLTASVASLAKSVEQMVAEQKNQGDRLKALEGRDGELWRKAVGYVITSVLGIVIGFIFRQIGF